MWLPLFAGVNKKNTLLRCVFLFLCHSLRSFGIEVLWDIVFHIIIMLYTTYIVTTFIFLLFFSLLYYSSTSGIYRDFGVQLQSKRDFWDSNSNNDKRKQCSRFHKERNCKANDEFGFVILWKLYVWFNEAIKSVKPIRNHEEFNISLVCACVFFCFEFSFFFRWKFKKKMR